MKQNLIFIIGPSATGKSKLGVQIASYFKSKVISADSMQVYRNLNISSAKLSVVERKSVEHFLLDDCNTDENFFVKNFLSASTKIIEKMAGENLTPIIVGGTFYYCEALIFDNFLSLNKDDFKFSQKSQSLPVDDPKHSYSRLCRVDPLMAEKLHPNDQRKIINSLSVFDKFGVPHSTILMRKGAHTLNEKYDVLLLWLDCSTDVLDERINQRVEFMLESGLLEEIYRIRLEVEGKGLEQSDLNITQAIGFVQLEKFFAALHKCIPDFDSFDDVERKAFFTEIVENTKFRGKKEDKEEWAGKLENIAPFLLEGVEKIKLKTRNYVKRQRKWIKNRFLPLKNLKIFKLDTTQKEKWEEKVLLPAIKICEDFLEHQLGSTQKTEHKEFQPNYPHASNKLNWSKFKCVVCNKTLNGNTEWTMHLSSRGHRRVKKKAYKKMENSL